MFFLLRMSFWLALVVLLLPLGLRGENGHDVSVFDAFGAFQAVVADARGFCDRQPQACAVGGQMVSHLMEKAQVGAKWLYEAVGEPADPKNRPPAALAQPGRSGLDTSAMPSAGQLELTPQDLLPVWGGSESGKPTAAIPRAPAAPAPSGQPPLPPRRPA